MSIISSYMTTKLPSGEYKMDHRHNTLLSAFMLILFITFSSSLLNAKDTDIYNVSTKQNCYILMDNSGSMDFGVYEHTIDYAAMFNYFFELNETGNYYNTYIYDTITNSDRFHNNHWDRRKIYLLKGNIGASITNIDGKTVSFTGDAADPDYTWYGRNLVETNTIIDSNGNLSHDGGDGTQRLTVDADGYVLLDGNRLPIGQDIKLHDLQTMFDGSQVDNGFGGLLNAPGYYFSGYESVTAGRLDIADHGDTYVYFFITGNWMNMQTMYNLHYVTYWPEPDGASRGDHAWKYESFPLSESDWPEVIHPVNYPEVLPYNNDLTEESTLRTITHPGAAKIKIHFSDFDVPGNGYVVIYDGERNEIARYDNDNKPTATDGWSAVIDGDTVQIALVTDSTGQADGYSIDKIKVFYGDYRMQNRHDVAKDALTWVIDAFHGKMNWGYANYHYAGRSADGARIVSAIDPSVTDDQNRQDILEAVKNDYPRNGGTPLGEALQDVFEKGYWEKRHTMDTLACRKNYIISVTDGYPSEDDTWDRISNPGNDPKLPFEDWDEDGWTADPYQYNRPPDNYYDDVGHWIYTHSWKSDTKDEVTDPENSYNNITTHHISFGNRHPLLMDAAEESGGQYVAAYNKGQLVAAFYSFVLQMTQAVSFTSPVVSIDAANKIQNDDDLYLGLFLPQDNQPWLGNIKKFKLGDGSAARPSLSMIYDSNNNGAISAAGEFKDNTAGFWGDDDDANDSDHYGSFDVREDGVGEVLKERVEFDFARGAYWDRPIYTWVDGLPSMQKIRHNTLLPSDIGVADELTRDKVLNYLYGYTFDANPSNHAPTATRDWILGAIVHSRPVIVEYYDPDNITVVLKRYIVAGANDGMLHVFDDATGQEVFAFVPPDMLPRLDEIAKDPFVETIDGSLLLYRQNRAPKYLVFGERRGGSRYWCLDISDSDPVNWTRKWEYHNPEIKQTWSDPVAARVPVDVDENTGKREFKTVLVFTGGYDPGEDAFPEPFNDIDYNGSPYDDEGNLVTAEWDQNNARHDVNNNDAYDKYNPGNDEYGRGIFIVDIDAPDAVTRDSSGKQILPFSVTYGQHPSSDSNGAVQTRPDMKFCFPASPSLVTETMAYVFKDSSNRKVEGVVTNVLKTVYAVDIYTNLYRIDYDFDIEKSDNRFSVSQNAWSVTQIFSGNPGSPNNSGEFDNRAIFEDPNPDQGRKAFYPPEISWGGSCSYFDRGNYHFTNTKFDDTNEIATLFFGTGDREHPSYRMIKNRFYAVYDDSRVTAAIIAPGGTESDLQVTGIEDSVKALENYPYYTEADLLNLTYNELDTGSDLTIDQIKTLKEILKDEPYDNSYANLEYGFENEDDAKGWYIVLEDQSDKDSIDHSGEKILSKVSLFAGALYFTAYQPSMSDPCNPQGNGLAYSLNYCDGTAAYNLDITNDSGSDIVKDVSDRYYKKDSIFGIPSGFSIIMRQGQAYAMTMMGGAILGPKMTGESLDDPDFSIRGLEFGLDLYYWKEGLSE